MEAEWVEASQAKVTAALVYLPTNYGTGLLDFVKHNNILCKFLPEHQIVIIIDCQQNNGQEQWLRFTVTYTGCNRVQT